MRHGCALFSLLLTLVLAAPAGAATVPADFEEIILAQGIAVPTSVAWAPDGRLFVATLDGRVFVVQGGVMAPDPVLDISDHVNVNAGRGVGGIAVDGDFEQHPYLYLSYVYDGDGDAFDSGPKSSRVTRVAVNPDSTIQNPGSPETVILGTEGGDAACPAPNQDTDCMPADDIYHTAGAIRADPDGTLWVTHGDGAAVYLDTLSLRSRDTASFAGKLIHIDRNGNGLPGHPFCPSEPDLTRVCTKLYAKGFRNPYRFALRGGGLGPIVGDVGLDHEEEVDLAQPGLDYGWPCFEGSIETFGWRDRPECNPPAYDASQATAPDFRYDQSVGATALGGPIYTGGEYPDAFDGTILLGDYEAGWIRRLRLGGSPALESFVEGADPIELVRAPNGNVVYTTAGNFSPAQGKVVEIAHCPVNCAPLARMTATPRFGDLPLNVEFDAGASTDPDGDDITHAWDFGNGSGATGETAEHEYGTNGVYTVTLTVTDEHGKSSTATLKIFAGNTPPLPSIDTPPGDFLLTAGVPVGLTGSAVDPQDGAVDPATLQWNVVLHHADHIHPFNSPTGPAMEFTPALDHDADSFYEVRLTARDADGLEGTVTRELRPRVAQIALRSEPPGAPLTYSGGAFTAPHDLVAAVGFEAFVSAESSFVRDGRRYEFAGWADGAPRLRELPIPEGGATLTALYRDPNAAGAGPKTLDADVLSGLRRDREGPVLTFTAGPGVGVMRGRATDPSGVRSVAVALRKRRRAGCRWWIKSTSKWTPRRQRCGRARWMTARLTRRRGVVRWRIRLPHTPRPGRYEVLFRAVDGAGNVGRRANGKRRLPLVVR